MDAADHLPARLLERFAECLLRVEPRTVIGHHRIHLLDPVPGCPDRHRLRHLRQRHRHPHDIRRAGGDDRSRRVHDHHRLLGFGGDRRHGQGVRRQAEADQDVDVVAGDQLLRQALGNVRRGPGRILLHDLDLLAGDRIAIDLHVGFHAAEDLLAILCEWPRELADHTELHHVLRQGDARECKQRSPGQQSPHPRFEFHCTLPPKTIIDHWISLRSSPILIRLHSFSRSWRPSPRTLPRPCGTPSSPPERRSRSRIAAALP